MRKLLFAAILIACISSEKSSAQFYKSVLPSPDFTSALEKIVLDYRFNFEKIKGDSIVKEGGTATFESLIKLPGTKQCTITYYNSKVDTSASWGAVVYSGSDFNEAVKAYQNTFRLVKKSHLNWIDRSLMRFTGDMETAREEVGFATSILYLDLQDERYKNFVAEVDLLGGSIGNWEVQLSLQKKKDDAERY